MYPRRHGREAQKGRGVGAECAPGVCKRRQHHSLCRVLQLLTGHELHVQVRGQKRTGRRRPHSGKHLARSENRARGQVCIAEHSRHANTQAERVVRRRQEAHATRCIERVHHSGHWRVYARASGNENVHTHMHSGGFLPAVGYDEVHSGFTVASDYTGTKSVLFALKQTNQARDR